MRIAFQVALVLGSICVIRVRAQISSFQHIVVIVQENRTPDNLFQGLCGPTYSLCPNPYDIQNFGIDSRGNKISLIQTPLGDTNDPDHSHQGFVRMCHLDTTTNQCGMDGLNSGQCNVDRCSFEFVDPADVGSYITIAQQYGWANFMFQTNQGPSAIAHQFIFAGTSAPSASDDMAATFVAENSSRMGCLAPLNVVYELISPQTAPKEFDLINNPLGTVCFSHDTMASLLDQQNPPLSWKYYTAGIDNI